MPIKYYDLGGLKKLHEIVMVGTHDAAITRGHGNVQTQTLNILQQATAGVRFFDLRIAAAKVAGTTGQPKGVELQAYHGSLSTKTKTRAVTIGGVTQNRQVERSTMKYEGWGLSLNSLLQDVRLRRAQPDGVPPAQVRQVQKLGVDRRGLRRVSGEYALQRRRPSQHERSQRPPG